MLKRVLRSGIGQAVLGWSIATIIRFTEWSTRWQSIQPESTRSILASGRPILLIFWHSRIMLIYAAWPSSAPMAMLQSPHPDGQIMARAIARLGVGTVWGSSTRNRGGAMGLRNIIRTLKRGTSIGITPDGPRGPRMRLNPGVVAAARLTGVPILPVAWNVRHRRALATWDQLLLARPFSRGVLIWGDPIMVPSRLSNDAFENQRRLVETCLNAVTTRADRHFGHEPNQPIDPDATDDDPGTV